jgi:hypothetical protein
MLAEKPDLPKLLNCFSKEDWDWQKRRVEKQVWDVTFFQMCSKDK